MDAKTTELLALMLRKINRKNIGTVAGDKAGPRGHIPATIQELCRGGTCKQRDVLL